MPPSGSIFPMGDTLVLCTATDAAGNTAACAFTVTIADREAPAIICPTNLIVVADLANAERGFTMKFHRKS
jgi:hypothetical protein